MRLQERVRRWPAVQRSLRKQFLSDAAAIAYPSFGYSLPDVPANLTFGYCLLDVSANLTFGYANPTFGLLLTRRSGYAAGCEAGLCPAD